MSKDLLSRVGSKALAVIDAIADRALTLPSRRKGPTKPGDVLGVRAVTDLVSGSLAPSAMMILLAVAVLGVLWFIAKIGLWAFLAAVWAIMIAIVYKLRRRIVLARVAEAVRRREADDDAKTNEERT